MLGILKTKHKTALCAISLIMALLIVAAAPAAVYAQINNPLAIEVKQTFTGPSGVEDTFIYILEALDAANPMPEGSENKKYAFQIKGNSTVTFPISYSQQGVYEYKLYQVISGNAYYTYDRRVYDIIVTVNEYLSVGMEVYLQNVRDKKEDKIVFANSYYREVETFRNDTGGSDPVGGNPFTGGGRLVYPPTIIPDDPVPAAAIEPADVPKTGDDMKAAFYQLLFVLGAAAAISAIVYLFAATRRKRIATE